MPNWKKVITSGSDAALNSLDVAGGITGSDVTIDNWGSISASLASINATGSTQNLQQVTDNGNTTTNDITVVGDITASAIESVTASIDYALINDKLQGNGSGFQFFAYNEDTVKVKFANWYSSNSRQYGMGQLWYETWFAAIDNQAQRDNRRIGFYLEEPNAGSTDSGTPGQHPSNARFYVDINGGYLSGSLNTTGDITGSALQLGNLGAENEILIVGANTEVTSSDLLAIDTVNQRVGIGTSTPQVKLDIVGESSGEAQVRVAQHDNTSDGPDIRFFKSHDTSASPSAVANNDYIGAVNAFAYDGSDYIQSGFFGFQADGTDGDSKFGLRTRVDGTLADRIAINAVGDVNIAENLTVTGDITGSDVTIDDWGSVSASLASLNSEANSVTLQEVLNASNGKATASGSIYLTSSISSGEYEDTIFQAGTILAWEGGGISSRPNTSSPSNHFTTALTMASPHSASVASSLKSNTSFNTNYRGQKRQLFPSNYILAASQSMYVEYAEGENQNDNGVAYFQVNLDTKSPEYILPLTASQLYVRSDGTSVTPTLTVEEEIVITSSVSDFGGLLDFGELTSISSAKDTINSGGTYNLAVYSLASYIGVKVDYVVYLGTRDGGSNITHRAGTFTATWDEVGNISYSETTTTDNQSGGGIPSTSGFTLFAQTGVGSTVQVDANNTTGYVATIVSQFTAFKAPY
jgi:hypothetical protein